MAESRPGTRRLRWSVVRAYLDPAVGHEQAGVRPVLIVSNEDFNKLAGLATVVPLTEARRAAQPWELLIPAATAGLPRDSLALIAQVRTISQERLRPPEYGRLVERTLRLTIARMLIEHLDFNDLDALLLEP